MSVGFDPSSLLDASRVADDVPAGPAFDAWRLRALSQEQFDALGAEGQLLYLAWAGLLAPTTHNTVPERFRVDAAAMTLGLWLDRARVLPESDPVGRQALVSLGCVVANLELAANGCGRDVEVTFVDAPAARLRPAIAGEPRFEEVARVRVASGRTGEARSFMRAILARKVVRAEFDDRIELPPGVEDELCAVVQRHAGLELHLLTDAASLLFLGKFQELADTTVINRDRFARELGEWLHEDAADEAIGMRGREFGLSPEATRRMRDGLSRRAPLLPDEIAAFAKVGNVGMRSASAACVITVDEDATAQRVAAGRAYEEMALLLHERGFATAMHAGITEVDAPNFALRGRLRTRRRPTVLFRTGKALHAADAARPHAARPRLADVLLPAISTS